MTFPTKASSELKITSGGQTKGLFPAEKTARMGTHKSLYKINREIKPNAKRLLQGVFIDYILGNVFRVRREMTINNKIRLNSPKLNWVELIGCCAKDN